VDTFVLLDTAQIIRPAAMLLCGVLAPLGHGSEPVARRRVASRGAWRFSPSSRLSAGSSTHTV